MKNYHIHISETLCRTVGIMANNEAEALKLARRLYREGEIILDADDFVDHSAEFQCDEVEDSRLFRCDYEILNDKISHG